MHSTSIALLVAGASALQSPFVLRAGAARPQLSRVSPIALQQEFPTLEDEVRSWRLRLPPDTLLSFRGRLRVNYLGFTVSSIKTLTGNYDFTYAGIQCYSPVN